MNYFKLTLIMFSCLTISCKKEKVGETPSTTGLLGHWSHYTGPDEYHYLSIAHESGSILSYTNGSWNFISQKKQWFLKDNHLFYGKLPGKNEKFEIDTFPQIASFDFTIGYDVVDSGHRYIWIDANLYHD